MRFAEQYNTVNLIRNGGFEFLDSPSSAPAFWSVSGAAGDATPPDSVFQVVTGHTPETVHGAPNYMRFLLYTSQEVELQQAFADRFIQMGFVSEMGDPPWEEDGRVEGGYPIHEAMLLRGMEVTFAPSIRVQRGSAQVVYRFRFVGLDTQDIEVYPSLASKDWVRPARSLDLGVGKLASVSVVLKKTGSEYAEVHVGSLALGSGSSHSLPFTGDPLADAIPRGTIVMAFGQVCPPGFKAMELSPPSLHGRVFPKSGASPSTEIEGAEEHNHSEAEMTMNPERGWDTEDFVPPPFDQNFGAAADAGDDAHTHPLNEADHVPPSRDVILCKRL